MSDYLMPTTAAVTAIVWAVALLAVARHVVLELRRERLRIGNARPHRSSVLAMTQAQACGCFDPAAHSMGPVHVEVEVAQ